ncbi:hypothetical protein HMPREF0731_0673, partial [Pseudoroseomonas cervicalis ATCC 49957]
MLRTAWWRSVWMRLRVGVVLALLLASLPVTRPSSVVPGPGAGFAAMAGALGTLLLPGQAAAQRSQAPQ